MTLNTFTSGVNTSFSTELNENFNGSKIYQVYSSTGLDTSASIASINGSSTITSTLELNEITASSLGSADYIRIVFTAYCTAYGTAANNNRGYGNNYLKIDTKSVGGSYTESYPNSVLQSFDHNSAEGAALTAASGNSFVWYHTLSNDEKTNGIIIKLTTTSLAALNTTTGSASASITLKQLVVEGVN